LNVTKVKHKFEVEKSSELLLKFILCLALLLTNVAEARQLVLYSPNQNSLADKVTLEIVKGIQSNRNSEIKAYNDKNKHQLLLLINKLSSEDQIISLGEGLLENQSLANSKLTHVTYGGFVSETDINGISLKPNPSLLFEKLTELKPGIKHLSTIVEQGYDLDHINVIKEAAKNYGLEFSIQAAGDVNDYASKLNDIVKNINPQDTSLLIIDGRFLKKVRGMRFIKKSAWKRKLITTSLVPKHSKDVTIGVLPDLYNYGISLSKYADTACCKLSFNNDYKISLNSKLLNRSGIAVPPLISSNSKVVLIR